MAYNTNMSNTVFIVECTVGEKKKKKNTPIDLNTIYRREMKLVPIIMDYCLL